MKNLEIVRSGTVEQLAAALERNILEGELAPGASLRESVLAEQLGVSRNTVREAIRGLVPGRLVRHIPNRGFVVTQLTSGDVTDIFRARESVELEAIRDRFDAARRSVVRLQSIVGRLAAHANHRDWAGVFEADRLFHLEVVRLLGSDRLVDFVRELFGELRLALIQVDRQSGDPATIVAEHRELVGTIRDDGRDAALRAFRRHLRAAARHLHRELSGEDTASSAGDTSP